MFEKDTAAGHLLILKLNETILKAGIIATRGGWPDSPFADKAEMLAVRKGVIPKPYGTRGTSECGLNSHDPRRIGWV